MAGNQKIWRALANLVGSIGQARHQEVSTGERKGTKQSKEILSEPSYDETVFPDQERQTGLLL